MLSQLRFYAFIISSVVVVTVLSQSPPFTRQQLLSEYLKAHQVYQQSLRLSQQENYDEHKEQQLNEQALLQFNQVLAKLDIPNRFNDSLYFFTSFTIGELHHYYDRRNEALAFYTKAIRRHPGAQLADSFLFRPYIYSGIIQYQQNNLSAASDFFNKADSIQQQYRAPLAESQRLYNTLGVMNYESGNYRQAHNYFSKALQVLRSDDPYYTDLMVNYKINLAQIHFKLEEYNEAYKLYNELLPLNRNRAEIYLNLGLINLHLGSPKAALRFFYQVPVQSNKVIRLYNNIATAFLELKNYDSAQYYLKKSFDAFNKGTQDAIGYGLALKIDADLHLAQNKPREALRYYSAALTRLHPQLSDTTGEGHPSHFSGVFSYVNLFPVLIGRAEAAHELYLETDSLKWADYELNAYKSAFLLIDYVQRTYNSDEARLFTNRSKYQAHVKPIDIAYHLYQKTGKDFYLESLYQLDQQNKASVAAFNQFVNEQRSTRYASLPDEERTLKTMITRISLKAAQSQDSQQQAAFRSQVADYELQLEKIQRKIPVSVPTGLIPSIDSLQKHILDQRTAIVSYHLSEDKITILVISSGAVSCIQQQLPRDFGSTVLRYISATRDASADVGELSKQLSNVLAPQLPPGIRRIVLIPDDELNYVAFETLQDATGKFLLEKYSIQYQYSTALLKKSKGRFESHETLGFAPFVSSGNDTFNKLPFSAKEMTAVKGKKFLGEQGTKANFISHVSSFALVHLATHAVAGSGAGASFIVFAGTGENGETKLYTEEIYNLTLQKTRLIILSACETASGDLVKGEGVISLSRAFTMAGCPNIITSLWKADDFSTAYLTTKIHFYLDKDNTIEEAVRNAKLDYLQDASINPRMKHPFYWSHLVFIGDLQQPGSSFNWMLITFIALVILSISFWLIRRKRR
jgi:CHAT domain-containing protein